MKTIELNPDGTFPHKKRPYMEVSFTTSTSNVPRFIPDPPKKKDWKKELKDGFIYVWLVVSIGTGTIDIVIQLLKAIWWVIKKI